MHACYKGSSFVQPALWFTLCAKSWRCDPLKVWVVRSAEACARQVRRHGLAAVKQVWAHTNSQGPIACLRVLLRRCRVEAAAEQWACQGDTLLDPLEAEPAVRRAFLLEAVRKADLSVAAARKGMGGLLSLDVPQARSRCSLM